MRSFVKQVSRGARRAFGSPPERKKAVHGLAARIVSRLGFRLYGPHTSWYENREFKEVWAEFPVKMGLIQDRRFNLYNLARAFSVVDGELAECGANIGRGCFLMLAANASNAKHLYAFDSFEGLSTPSSEDQPTDVHAQPWEAREFAVDEAETRSNLRAFEGRFTLLKGWIPDRFVEIADKRFSFVHIDVDLYEPTRDSIEFFWPRLNPGGLAVCDDYGSRRCSGARKAMDEFAEAQGLRVAELSAMQGLLFKPMSS